MGGMASYVSGTSNHQDGQIVPFGVPDISCSNRKDFSRSRVRKGIEASPTADADPLSCEHQGDGWRIFHIPTSRHLDVERFLERVKQIKLHTLQPRLGGSRYGSGR